MFRTGTPTAQMACTRTTSVTKSIRTETAWRLRVPEFGGSGVSGFRGFASPLALIDMCRIDALTERAVFSKALNWQWFIECSFWTVKPPSPTIKRSPPEALLNTSVSLSGEHVQPSSTSPIYDHSVPCWLKMQWTFRGTLASCRAWEIGSS
ncbi:hypothetical protein H257_18979 [Aphanomyces astaci]|uniref:Uncharacterized protein n=1 Tax=Aphanomyces astaci TaxID=112090 RepID=W4FBM0_APHAT|nr:hypothetical protein H257_18979 [Aphanomyces astaci]ETV64083.1 hypothetical protein H257_18979 [Aphanomyces astaci]|eukprot:XP_009846433.1 hypothetical protein H257_18979 [Aphanomyces astaci]